MKANQLNWTGRVVTALAVLFLLFDSAMKLVEETHVRQATAQLGFPQGDIVGMGLVLLAGTVLYVVPRTSILGAILLTGYLGGATASQVRIDGPYLFPVFFGAMVWLGIFLRDARLRALVPLRGPSL